MASLFDTRVSLQLMARYYQALACEEAFRLWDEGIFGVLVRAATGAGKTPIACLIADRWLARSDMHRVMVISYETQLVWQFAQEIQDFLGIEPAIEMEKQSVNPEIMPRIVVACRASLLQALPARPEQVEELVAAGIDPGNGCLIKRWADSILKLLRKGCNPSLLRDQLAEFQASPEVSGQNWSRVHKFDPKYNWLLIWDEAHRHAYHLTSVGHVVDWFRQNEVARQLGLTATPQRFDSVSLGHKMFPGIALDYPLLSPTKSCALKDGYAVPYIQKYIQVEGVDFANIKKLNGDFDEADLERQLGNEETLAKLCIPMLEMAEERRTLIFSPGVEMAKNVAAFINARSKVKCPQCSARFWTPTKLIGDGAACACGRVVEPADVIVAGNAAQAVWGAVPDQDRKEIYRRHQSGAFQFLSVCGLCVAKGTSVLTDRGEIPIEQVTTDMKLWDGVEFVSHDGVISKGEQPVIRYAGLTATGDHNVWTDDGWKRFAACKQQRIAIKVSAVGGKAVRESCGYYRGDHSTWQEPPGWLGGALRRLRETLHQVLQRVEDWPVWLQALRKTLRRAQLVIDALPLRKEAVREPERRVLRRLRRPWSRVPVCFAYGNGSLGHEEFGTTHGIDPGPQEQQRPLRTGKHSLGQPDGTGEQQETSAEVFDILNAGPRHRFTANGLIVSNCREGYNDPDVSCVAIFRPVSKKASGLADQMKGRSCRPKRGLVEGIETAEERLALIAASDKPNALIIDLVGVTGLGDCPSTIEIYAEGLPDEVKQKAEQILLADGGDVLEAITEAQQEIEEERERLRLEREAAERRRQDEAEKRAKADAKVSYTTHEVGHGGQRNRKEMSEGQLKFIRSLGMKLERVILTTKEAGRIIDLLRCRKSAEEVANSNGLLPEQWEAVVPSTKQLDYVASFGVDLGTVKVPYDASQLIQAKKYPGDYLVRKLKEIREVRTEIQLTGIGHDLRLVHGILPEKIWKDIVQAGKRQREILIGRGESWEGD